MGAHRADLVGDEPARICQSVLLDLFARPVFSARIFTGVHRHTGLPVYGCWSFKRAFGRSPVRSNRVQDRICLRPSHPPSMYMLLFLPGNWVYPSVFITGFFVLATLPLGVALAQKLAPQGKSMASSLMMGLAYGTGGLLTPLTGKLADIFAIRPVLSVLAIIPLLSIALIHFLFKERAVSVTR